LTLCTIPYVAMLFCGQQYELMVIAFHYACLFLFASESSLVNRNFHFSFFSSSFFAAVFHYGGYGHCGCVEMIFFFCPTISL
uniref:Tr-type G domain-containing protein n=1 Tax=Parascaris univalens TaxID=6257 RepID=A0A915BU61_PARUN